MLRRVISRVVDASGRHPLAVLLGAILVIAATWTYAYKELALHSDLLELLPRESPAFKAFEHQLGRVGGGAALIVVVESPNRAANEKMIDGLSAELDASLRARKACVDACKGDGACTAKCPEELISYVENGTKDVRRFFGDHKWLYADVGDLEEADTRLDHEIATRTGSVVDLFDDGPSVKAPPSPPPPAPTAQGDPLGLAAYRQKLDASAQKLDLFPTGYFATQDGKMMAVRIVSSTRGMGDPASERLLANVKEMVERVNPKGLEPAMQIGYAGDIPNAIEEKDSLVSDAAWATGAAFVLIFVGLVAFFRSPWAPFVIALPAFIGVGFAYAFAAVAYGYVNSTGAFLGAIILGNGINYPIVLLNRYREFRARGMTPEVARREAVINAFRAELVGALVASIAYGSLVVTRFRGFNQFGVIGFVGMLLVWISMIPCVPALLAIDEWIQARAPSFLRDKPVDGEHAFRGPVMKLLSTATARAPWLFIVLSIAGAIWAGARLEPHVKDPWEYDFGKLGSKSSAGTGAGAWSSKADVVFGGKTNIAGALMLADTPEQVPLIKEAILANDAKDPKGRLIQAVATVADFLPGPLAEQQRKLEILARMKGRLTPRVMHELTDAEKKTIDELMPPPELAPIEGKELPPLIRRRFEENDGRIGTVLYVQPRNDVPLSDGHVLLRMAATTDNLVLPNGAVVPTASWWTVYAEIIRSISHDGPLATLVSLGAVALVVIAATRTLKGSVAVISSLLLGVLVSLGAGVALDMKLNFVNFIALPITFGIGCEYPFNVFDRSRLLGGDVRSAVALSGGAVALCSYTTTIGYGSLLFSDQMALQSFGKLAMCGEIACLTGAVLFMPALLQVVSRRRTAKT